MYWYLVPERYPDIPYPVAFLMTGYVELKTGFVGLTTGFVGLKTGFVGLKTGFVGVGHVRTPLTPYGQ